MKNIYKILFSLGAMGMVSTTDASQEVEYQTNLDKKIGQPEIVVRISDRVVPPQDVKIILNGIEAEIKNGVRYKAGETLQLGFMLNRFEELSDGRLILEEPDMKSFPIKFIPSMNNTFKTLRNQKDVVESIGKNIELNFPSIRQAIVVHKDYKLAKAVLLERIAPEGSQSGWWVHLKGDSKPEDYSLTSLYQFALDRPDLVQYLALPVGAKVYDIKESPIKIYFNDKEATFQDGSYLAELNKRISAKK
jgi:hypothetical protein